MLLPFTRLGSIEDLGFGLRWDASTLAREVERRAAALCRMQIGRGSIVAIAHHGSAFFFADLFAVWTAGATAACLDGSLTEAELETIVHFAKPAAFLVAGERAASSLPVPVLELGLAPSPATGTFSGFELDDPALVLFTSGTTGAPKGVVLTFRALLTRVALNEAAIGKGALARALVTLPTHFGHGLIGNALTPLMAGGEIVLHPTGVSLAQNLGRILDDHRITFMSSVPALWPMAMKLGKGPLRESLVRVHVGSAPLSSALWSNIVSWTGAEVVNCYGMTETANWLAGASSAAGDISDGLVGRMWGGTAAVLDDDGIQAVGEGEIVVQTPTLMSGYLNRPDLTATVVRDGWYHTGDRGTVDVSGQVRLTGRVKDEINRAGFKVQPGEIDMLLERHPAVAEVCVFGIADAVGGEVVAAAVKLAGGATETAESLRAWCRQRLRREAVPERWFFVDEIPRTGRGKVGRDAVRRHVMKDLPNDRPGRATA